ncbi:Uncharacterised protein [Enterobacter hormaechei]|nr:Uncharacterised protein [Enterobacter hormaechei]
MPFTDIIEAYIIVASFFKKGTEPTNSILNTSDKGCKRTMTMYGYFTNDENIIPDIFTHKNTADFTLTSFSERCLH